MSKRKAKKAFKKLTSGKPISRNEINMILKSQNTFNKMIVNYFYKLGRIVKKPKNHLIGGLVPSINPGLNPLILDEGETMSPLVNHDKFVDEFTNQIAIIFQVPVDILRGKYDH